MRALLVSGLVAAALTTTGGAQQQPATLVAVRTDRAPY